MTFAEKVYDAVTRIPKGRVATYGQIAEIIGCPGGSRAVGNALHVNPFAPRDRFSRETGPAPAEDNSPVGRKGVATGPIPGGHKTVPCHRVVAADGSLAANFGCGGPAVQYERLREEGVAFRAGSRPGPGLAEPDARRAGQAPIASGELPRVDLAKCGIVIEKHPLEPFLPANGRILFLGSFPPPQARWSMDFFYPNWINDFWRVQGLIHFQDPHWFEAKADAPAATGRAELCAGPAAQCRPSAASRPAAAPKRFDKSRIVEFCRSEGLAFYDTAAKVCRWKGNASDEFLEIIQPSDIAGMLSQMPDCQTIVTTGGKSADELAALLASLPGASFPDADLPDVSLPASRAPHPAAFPSGTPHQATAQPLPVPAVGAFLDLTVCGRAIRWWRMPSTSRAFPLPLQAKASHYAKLWHPHD